LLHKIPGIGIYRIFLNLIRTQI